MRTTVPFVMIISLGLFFVVGCHKEPPRTPPPPVTPQVDKNVTPQKDMAKPAQPADEKATGKPADLPTDKAVGKPADKPVDKPVDKPADKPIDKPIEKK
jgi:hypothetical protein